MSSNVRLKLCRTPFPHYKNKETLTQKKKKHQGLWFKVGDGQFHPSKKGIRGLMTPI